jgi:hypothetical protein
MLLNARVDVLTAVLQKIQLFGDFMLPHWETLSYVSKGRIAFLFRIKRSKMSSNFFFYCLNLKMETFNDPSKRGELFT